MSANRSTADMWRPCWHVCNWQIVLKKSFPADERNFSGPLMRFARRDVRDHNAFHKNDHGPSYCPWRALQRYKRLNIDFRELFRVVRFSTFSTLSALTGHAAVVAGCPLLRVKRTWIRRAARSESDPKRTSAWEASAQSAPS